MDDAIPSQSHDIMRQLRRVVYAIKKPQMLLLDLESTLLDIHGHQEEEGFNFHYQSQGYHPLVCYDGMTGDLLKITAKVVYSVRYTIYKFCSSCPY